MCLIVAKKAGADRMSKSDMRKVWRSNNDGSGYCFVDGEGNLIIRKPYFKLKKFIRDYNRDYDKYGRTSPFIIHFRLATSGELDDLNTHPHSLAGGRVALAHNGVFHNDPPHGAKISDTVWFCYAILGARSAESLYSESVQDIMETVCGPSNKLALLRDDRQLLIINEDKGEWNDAKDTWYSQMHWNWGGSSHPMDNGYYTGKYGGTWKRSNTNKNKTTADVVEDTQKLLDHKAVDDASILDDDDFEQEERERFDAMYGFGAYDLAVEAGYVDSDGHPIIMEDDIDEQEEVEIIRTAKWPSERWGA